MTLVQADARALPFAAGVVQCVVTSPPYWGLRDYGTATWSGGDQTCDHRHQLGGEGAASAIQNGNNGSQSMQYRRACRKCGAQRIDRQIGLEDQPAAYVDSLVAVFRQVRRILRPDGVVFLNLGDTYNTGASNQQSGNVGARGSKAMGHSMGAQTRNADGLKFKDLIGIPWRVAFALQADGWYLRSDIVWSKPNPMPESVTDRPTRSHEYVFLLAKSERYYWNADAIRQPYAHATLRRGRSIRQVGADGDVTRHGAGEPFDATQVERGANVRSVWTIPVHAYRGAHFAVMPERLVARCIVASTRSGDLVCDPFVGSGTVARVAFKYGRRAIGCDLRDAYVDLARTRCAVTLGLPFDVGHDTSRDQVPAFDAVV